MFDNRGSLEHATLSGQEEAQWISLSDLMTGLMMIFMLIALLFMLKVQADVARNFHTNDLNAIAEATGSDGYGMQNNARQPALVRKFKLATLMLGAVPAAPQVVRDTEGQYSPQQDKSSEQKSIEAIEQALVTQPSSLQGSNAQQSSAQQSSAQLANVQETQYAENNPAVGELAAAIHKATKHTSHKHANKTPAESNGMCTEAGIANVLGAKQ